MLNTNKCEIFSPGKKIMGLKNYDTEIEWKS